ncbi:MAG TPA: signal peptide peptidase SppA [Myxococcota bacterium]|nr:signal peptide peptidase SppA [Myxococcota bacterium]
MALKKGTRLLLWISGLGLLIFTAATVAVILLVVNDQDFGDFSMASADGESRWLQVHLEGPIADGPKPDSLIVDPEDIPLTVHDIAAAIHVAADDEDIDGLVLHLDGHGLGLVGAQEIRRAVERFDEADKECRTWSKVYENIDWYIASACDEIHLHPEGVPMAIGLKISTSYYAGTFEKIGVAGDFERVGEFKSAIETYERTGPSEPSVMMYEALLDSLWWSFTDDIARGRGVDQAEIETLIDDPPVTATTALERGMVDALTYKDEFDDQLEDEGVEYISLEDYAVDLRNDWRGADEKVAVVHLQGTIIDGESSSGGFAGDYIGDATTVELLEELAEDDEIIAVVLRINSPGGSALASDVMWRAIENLDEEKPVVTSMASYAASGGYYLSMATRHIVAEPGTLTGSIGVFGGKFAMADLYEKLGISTWSSQRGQLAMLYNLTDPFTDAERAKVRERIEAFYDTFVAKAADGRGMTWDEIDAVAGGRVWTGAQALEVGLVDELGGIEDAVAVAMSEAGVVKSEDVGRRVLPRRQTLIEVLLKSLNEQQVQASQEQALREIAGDEVVEALAAGHAMQRVLEVGGIAAMDPVRITIH